MGGDLRLKQSAEACQVALHHYLIARLSVMSKTSICCKESLAAAPEGDVGDAPGDRQKVRRIFVSTSIKVEGNFCLENYLRDEVEETGVNRGGGRPSS
jgi:hypothetical protein